MTRCKNGAAQLTFRPVGSSKTLGAPLSRDDRRKLRERYEVAAMRTC